MDLSEMNRDELLKLRAQIDRELATQTIRDCGTQSGQLYETICDRCGIDQGGQFFNEREVREYFTVDTLSRIFNDEPEDLPDQNTLDSWADAVIENRWHCAF